MRRNADAVNTQRRALLIGGGALAAAPLIGLTGCAVDTKAPTTARAYADLVFLGGEIHTVNATRERVSALAVADGRILATGSDSQIAALIGPDTRRVNLQGRTLLPGINDSHLHLKGWSLEQPPFAINLSHPKTQSIADCVAEVRKAVAKAAPNEWILGRGWDQAYFAENRPPTAADLDRVSPHNPVALTDFSGHAVWANSRALQVANITATTEAPAGGMIVKNTEGEPSGVLLEGAAWVLDGIIPANSPERIKAALRAAMQSQLSRGITSATEPGLDAVDLRLLGELALESDQPRMRMTGLIKAGTNTAQLAEALRVLEELRSSAVIDRRWLQFAGIKIMGDGIPTGNKTAWLHEPYVGGGNGSLLLDGDTHEERTAQLRTMIAMAHRAGAQIGTHVTGDRSIDEVIAAYAAVQRSDPRDDPRHYLIHADLVSPNTLKEMQRLGVSANFNPEIKHLIADSQVASIGAQRAAYEWPFRTAIDTGVMVASSSDSPVTAGNWLQGLATCVDRKGKQTGKVSGAGQRITLDEAIHSYTLAGAWQDRADDYKGSLEPGKVADLCVLDERLSAIDSASYPAVQVGMTLIDGQIVHNSLG